MKTLLAPILFSLFLIGCASAPETIIRTNTLTVVRPGTQDTLTIVRHDTVWTATNPRYVVRIDTVKQRVYVWRNADTVKVPYPDTVKITKKEIIQTPFLSKLGLVFLGIVIGGGIIFAAKRGII